MSVDASPLGRRLEEMRKAFDSAFAAPPAEPPRDTEDLLAVRVAGDAYAVPALDIAGIASDLRVTPVPGPVPELLGLAGFRGTLFPVYGLGMLLGYPPSAPSPRWFALCESGGTIALAFDAFEGHLRIHRGDLCAAAGSGAPREHVRMLAKTGSTVRGVIRVPDLTAAIRRRLGAAAHGRGP